MDEYCEVWKLLKKIFLFILLNLRFGADNLQNSPCTRKCFCSLYLFYNERKQMCLVCARKVFVFLQRFIQLVSKQIHVLLMDNCLKVFLSGQTYQMQVH